MCKISGVGCKHTEHVARHREERKAALNRLLKGAVRLTLSQFGKHRSMSEQRF